VGRKDDGQKKANKITKVRDLEVYRTAFFNAMEILEPFKTFPNMVFNTVSDIAIHS
jgi:type III secretory pathway lipoprotein EscJ